MISHIQIQALGYDTYRIIDEDRFLAVQAMTFGKGRLHLCTNIWGPDESYCYARLEHAIAEMRRWHPDTESEPTGWMRHLQTGRRRPQGHPAQEYIQW